MPGAGVRELAGVGVEADAGEGDHLVAVDVAQHAPDDLGGRDEVLGVDVERVALPSHDGSRADPLAADVADAELDEPVGPTDRVVPVAADLDRVSAGEVVPGELDPASARQPRGKQAALEPD